MGCLYKPTKAQYYRYYYDYHAVPNKRDALLAGGIASPHPPNLPRLR